MKTTLLRIAICIFILIVGFFAGRFAQHNKTGYHFSVRESKEYPFSFGAIRWSYVTESVGVPFLDPGTTILEFDHRVIYKAQRSFQEDFPFAKNISTEGGSVVWNDGQYKFQLTVSKSENQK